MSVGDPEIVVSAASAGAGSVGAPSPEIAAAKIQGRSPWRLAFERLRSDRAAIVCAVLIILIVLMAVFAPVFQWITGHPPNHQYFDTGLSLDGQPRSPNGTFWLGTDDVGRDVLVRIAYGARVSLVVGVVATFLTVTIGTIVGLAAGYFGKLVDTVLARIIDVMLSIPFLLFAISLASIFHAGLKVVIFVLAIFSWSSVARIVRGQVLSIREREYVEAARAMGAGSWRIMIIDILPNVIAPIIVYTTLLIPVSIVGEATLSFLGVGVQPPTADWGQMISDAQGNYHAWWFLVFPSLALLLTTLAFNIFGDGVRDAFDPRSDRMFK
ncbi:MAG TPA: ABC transporter permease [Mycobacteriales bacterium]|jgi:peptide/nickel transport system permease protein|nr:ABC transporter permease [Mycobacteriales bacterium]